jgi:hypothetical protein
MDELTYAPPARLAARRGPALVVGAVGLGVCAVGFAVNRDQFFRAYLIAYMFWLGIALGSMALMMVHHMSGGAWGTVIRRIFEASTRTLPMLAVLFLPIVFGLSELYPWAHADRVAHDAVMKHQAVYLNVPFFLARAAIYFGAWISLAWLLNRWSLDQDHGDVATATRRMQLLSGAGLVIYGLTITFASVDWVMSLNPHWFSTIFGFLVMGGQGLAGLAFTVVVATVLSRSESMKTVYSVGIFQDLGKLMLTFVMLWAYFNFSQYLLIYSANLVEEVPYYLARTSNGWGYVAAALVVFQFSVPFVLLLSRDLKRNASRLVLVAVGILAMRGVDLFFLISPEFAPNGMNVHLTGEGLPTHLFIHWLDIAAPIGIGGVWLGLFLSQLARRPLLPMRDPHLAEALAHVGGH